jgi:hypothetical protein
LEKSLKIFKKWLMAQRAVVKKTQKEQLKKTFQRLDDAILAIGISELFLVICLTVQEREEYSASNVTIKKSPILDYLSLLLPLRERIETFKKIANEIKLKLANESLKLRQLLGMANDNRLYFGETGDKRFSSHFVS